MCASDFQAIMALPRCNLHKRLIIRFIWLLSILGAFYILAVFAMWSRASIQPPKSLSSGPSAINRQKPPNQPSIAALEASDAPQHQQIQQADARQEPNSASSQSPAQVFVHTFYYGWYGTPQVDHGWIHWNHPILPHWCVLAAHGSFCAAKSAFAVE